MSNNNNTEEISHELNSERARRYVERQRALENYINGTAKVHGPTEDETDISISEFNANDMNAAAGMPDAVVEEAGPQVQQAAAPAAQQQQAGDSVIRIKDMKAPVTLLCEFTGKQGRKKKFSVRLNAISVDVSDNGISLMLNDAVSVEPPITEQMRLTYKGIHYTVVFTGGIHRFGPFVNMYFTRLTNTPEEEPGTEEPKA